MNVSHLRTPFRVKAAGAGDRRFRGLASTWGPDPDSQGDVIARGAFADSLAAWRADGTVMPLLDQHSYFSIGHVLGRMTDARETADGLDCEWEIVDAPSGDEALARIRGGYVTGLSIGFIPVESREPTADELKRRVKRVIERVHLMEVSLVIWGANPDALITGGGDRSREARFDRSRQRMLASRLAPFLEQQRTSEQQHAESERRRRELQDFRLKLMLNRLLPHARDGRGHDDSAAA